jgi:hypothetical protein
MLDNSIVFNEEIIIPIGDKMQTENILLKRNSSVQKKTLV